MWIKKNSTLINLEKFDVIIGYFNQTHKILDEISEAMKNGESVYVLPCEKK